MASTVWKGYLSFGLVSFPVRLFTAARAEGIHFHMLHKKDLSRIKEVWYCVEEDKPVERTEIVKGYETGKGEYVVVEDEELKKVAPESSSSMEVLQFVESGEVDALYFESSYYVVAEEKQRKPYALFVSALAESKRNAIAKIVLHNREHVVLIRPFDGGLVLHTLFYANELRAGNRFKAEKTPYSGKELQMAKSLVTALTAPFDGEKFHDSYRENVAAMIDQKRKGQSVKAVKQPRRAAVIDLTEALKRSLKAVEKAPGRKTKVA